VALISKARMDIDEAAIDKAIARANTRLPDYARVARWSLLPEPPTLINGMLTPNGRPRCERILDRYASLIDELYEAQPTPKSA
jgi:long-subunit acyl-CoA synthetase (AMP-forming)